MAFWKRGSKKKSKRGGAGESPESRQAVSSSEPDGTAFETSPQRVGVVSGVLSTTAESGASSDSLFGDVVSRRFAPASGSRRAEDGENDVFENRLPPRYATEALSGNDEMADAPGSDESNRSRGHLRAAEPLFPDHPATPELEVDLMAHIGRATTITGNIVAEEDLEIQGTIEGSVRLPNHQVTIGAEGHVKASVEAQIVMVYGKITGDVVASDLVELEKGGIVGGDIKAPRIIMHDGAIVVGGIDMSASLPNGNGAYEPTKRAPERPHLAPVAPTTASDASDSSAEDDEGAEE